MVVRKKTKWKKRNGVKKERKKGRKKRRKGRMWLGLVWFYGISTFVYIYIYI